MNRQWEMEVLIGELRGQLDKANSMALEERHKNVRLMEAQSGFKKEELQEKALEIDQSSNVSDMHVMVESGNDAKAPEQTSAPGPPEASSSPLIPSFSTSSLHSYPLKQPVSPVMPALVSPTTLSELAHVGLQVSEPSSCSLCEQLHHAHIHVHAHTYVRHTHARTHTHTICYISPREFLRSDLTIHVAPRLGFR